MSKKLWFQCLKSMVFATLASLGALIVCAIVIAAALNSIGSRTFGNIAICIIIMAAYAVFLYIFHMRNRLDTYAEHTNKFDPKKELIAYVKTEGKTMFIFYGAIAIVSEISHWITSLSSATPNPVTFVSQFCIGPWVNMTIPVLRSVIAFVYSAVIVCLLAVLRSRKIFQNETEAKATRKHLQE